MSHFLKNKYLFIKSMLATKLGFYVNIAFLTYIYFLVAQTCFKFATVFKDISPIWLPTGLSILFVLVGGKKYLWSVFFGALTVNYKNSLSLSPSVLIAIGNMLEAYTAFIIYIKLIKFRKQFVNLNPILAILSMSLLSPIVSASVGVLTLYLFNKVDDLNLMTSWMTWWVGDFGGAIMLSPMALLLREREFYKLINCFKEVNLFKISIWVMSIVSLFFQYYLFKQNNSLKYAFVLFLSILIFTFLSNRLVIYLLTVSLNFIIIYLTMNGQGPFVVSTQNQNLINIEILLASIMLASIFILYYIKTKFFSIFRSILALGWFFWGVVFFNLQQEHQKNDQVKMSSVTASFEKRIQERMGDYIFALNSGASLFKASGQVTSQEWKTFVDFLGVQKAYEGINGMGVIFKIDHKNLAPFVNHFQKSMDEKFKIKFVPQGYGNQLISPDSIEDHYIITYIEPIEKNKPARGLDVASESNRKIAADKALKTGLAAMTDKIVLVQDNQKRNGFLLYLPVYKNPENLVLTNEESKIKYFSHWIYAPFVTQHFLDEVFKDEKINYKLSVFEDSNYFKESLLYESSSDEINKNVDEFVSTIELAQKKFWLKWQVKQTYAASHDFLSTWIGFIGTFSILILASFVVNLLQVQEKAEAIANKLNQDFKTSQNLLKIQEAKMIESSRMASLGEMAGSIAHEINNPLAIISLSSQQILKSIRQTSDVELKNQLQLSADKIIKTTERISKIIKGLRFIARDAENDSMRFVSIENLILDTISLCQEKFKLAGINLNLVLNYKGEIYCRDTQISQVLLNLLNNSFDAIENLNVKWIEVGVKEHQGELFITVTDSGQGITKELQNKIMEPFFTTKGVGKGTGLGLSISKGIIESHSGEFYINTNSQQTQFVIKLPLTKHSQMSTENRNPIKKVS